MLLLENYLVYPGTPATRDWMPAPIADIQDVDLVTESGTKIHGWWLPCPDSERTLLYFHGNGGNLSHRGGSMVNLSKALDTAVFMVDYPGYGKSQGSTTEAGCYESATAAYDWLTQTQNRDPKRAHPLRSVSRRRRRGGAGHAEAARSRRPGEDVHVAAGCGRQPVSVSAGALADAESDGDDRPHSLDQQPGADRHGDADHLIPFAHGQHLFAAALEPKIFVRLPGQGHDESLGADFFVPLKTFLNTHMPTAVVSEPK